MDKRVANADVAIEKLFDGAVILAGGFGTCGVPDIHRGRLVGSLVNAIIPELPTSAISLTLILYTLRHLRLPGERE